jgi:DNA-binding MarR family transcriptional regulator
MYKKYESLGYLINQSARLMQKTMRQQLREDEVQPSYLPVMLWLSEEDGLTQADLCVRAAIEQPSMAELLKRMEASKLILRKTNKEDKRRRTIHLTAIGRRRLAEIQEWLQISNKAMQRGVTPEELVSCFGVLRKVLKNLEDDSSRSSSDHTID